MISLPVTRILWGVDTQQLHRGDQMILGGGEACLECVIKWSVSCTGPSVWYCLAELRGIEGLMYEPVWKGHHWDFWKHLDLLFSGKRPLCEDFLFIYLFCPSDGTECILDQHLVTGSEYALSWNWLSAGTSDLSGSKAVGLWDGNSLTCDFLTDSSVLCPNMNFEDSWRKWMHRLRNCLVKFPSFFSPLWKPNLPATW